MSNPYEPPQPPKSESSLAESDAAPFPPLPDGDVRFAGGTAAILAIGAATGAVLMMIYFVLDYGDWWVPNPLYTTAVFWIGALMAAMALLQGISVPLKRRILITCCVLPIAYVLYVPVCSIGALALNAGDYRVRAAQVIPASVVSFAAIYVFVCSRIRRYLSKPPSVTDTESAVNAAANVESKE